MWHCIWKCSDDYKDLNIIMGPQNNSNPWYLNRVKVFINYNCQTENMKIMGTWVIDLKFATSVMSGDFVHFPICHEILTPICIWKISTLKYFKWILLYKLSVSIIYTVKCTDLNPLLNQETHSYACDTGDEEEEIGKIPSDVQSLAGSENSLTRWSSRSNWGKWDSHYCFPG
jgi:hypothetical protein